MRYILTIAIVWLSFSSGCAPKPPAIYVDQLSPIPLKADIPFTPAQDGWFLSNPVLAELLESPGVIGRFAEIAP